MRRSNWLIGVAAVTLGALVASAAWAELPPRREFLPRAEQNPVTDPAVPMITVLSGDTVWVNAHTTGAACPGSPTRGGEVGPLYGPRAHEVWCFEGGPGDSTSVVGARTYVFNSYDRRVLRDDLDSLYWHSDTFQAISTRSMWCGGNNSRTGNWVVTTGGYGNYWQQVMQLDLTGPFNLTNGCSLQFKSRYTLECNYDYGYLEVWSFRSNRWNIADAFNGKSGCTVISPTKTCFGDWNNYRGTGLCPGSIYGGSVNYPGNFSASATRDYPAFPYAGVGNAWLLIRGDSVSTTPASTPIRVRWRFMSDTGLSAADGATAVKGWWIDDVSVKAAGATIHTQNFDTVPVGGLPGAPYSFPRIDPVYDGWAIRYDLDPPLEGYFLPSPGDSGVPSACQLNASWQWSITPNGIRIPAPDNTRPLPGYQVHLVSPTIPLNYTDGDPGQGPPAFSKPSVIVQYDQFQNMDPVTSDYTDTLLRVHRVAGIGPWAATGAWSEWTNIDGFITYGGGTFWNLNTLEALGQFTSVAGLDSMQFCWGSLDTGRPGDASWDPALPPHIGTQYVVDNVSIGIVDGSGTTFAAGTRRGQFQDTFNLHSCMHTENLANNDLGSGRYLLFNEAESLEYNIVDPNGLAAGNVKLWYSLNGGAFVSKNMNLSVPSVTDPASGGVWRTTICDTPWTPGSQIRYYIEATDGLGNKAYNPSSSAPTASPQTYRVVEILPTPGAKILLVDDNNRGSQDFTPCRQDTVTYTESDFYEKVLNALGYEFMVSGGYDKYDVNSESSNQRINEPWGFWTASPATPDSGFRQYDVIIWTTGPGLNVNTIQDTTQTFLKQFVFHGGKVLVSGDRIGENLATVGVAQDPDFYGNLLGAEYLGFHAGGLNDADRFPTVPSSPVGPVFAAGDSMHTYSGCGFLRPDMDKIRLKTTGLPSWSHPTHYLIYDDTTTPFDSVAGIYNFTTFTADTGKVVYLPWSLSALVDDYTVTCDPPASSPYENVGLGRFQGRGQLMRDIFGIFGLTTRTDVTPLAGFVNALSPASPNPFNPKTTIKFSLANQGQVNLAIYDVSGRRVKSLVNEVRGAGQHEMIWDGRNDSGHQVASGLYFMRMEAKGFNATEKLTLLK